MSIDNPGNFFTGDSFEDDENNDPQGQKPMRIYGRQLFKKSVDILNVTQSICDLMPDGEYEEITKGLMLQNAVLVPAKIKGSLAANDIYRIMMENAVIIKVNICELNDQLWACDEIHGIEKKYIEVLREEIALFKMIFIHWVDSFDRENDYPDEWHLFNNPANFPDEDDDE